MTHETQTNDTSTYHVQPEIDIDFHFPFEDSMRDFENDYPGEYDLDNSPLLETVLMDTATQALQEAFRELQPLLQKYPIDSIRVDFHMLGDEGVGAHMFGSRSTTSNHIVLGFMPGMMSELLTKYWYPNSKTLGSTRLYVHHELVHAVDYQMKPWFFHDASPIQPLEHFIRLWVTYRLESLSCLVNFLRGIGSEKSVRKARLLLSKSLNLFMDHAHTTIVDWKNIKILLDREAKLAYQLGPLMMLHVLWVKSREAKNQPLEMLVTKAVQLTPLTDAEIITVIDAGLEIDLQEYLVTLTAPGLDGEPFVSCDLLTNLFKTFNGWHITCDLQGNPIKDDEQLILEKQIQLKELNNPNPEFYQFEKGTLEYHIDAAREHIVIKKQCADLMDYFIQKVAYCADQDARMVVR